MDPEWRCISYFKWGHSIAILVYQRVGIFLLKEGFGSLVIRCLLAPPHEPATAQQQKTLEKMLQNCRFDSKSNCKVLVDLKEGMCFRFWECRCGKDELWRDVVPSQFVVSMEVRGEKEISCGRKSNMLVLDGDFELKTPKSEQGTLKLDKIGRWKITWCKCMVFF